VVGLKINDYDRTGSNTLSNNTIKETACGVWTANSTGDTVGPNTFLLNTMTTCP
jgi:parallel beta-helix repeat protein